MQDERGGNIWDANMSPNIIWKITEVPESLFQAILSSFSSIFWKYFFDASNIFMVKLLTHELEKVMRKSLTNWR